MNPLTLLLSSPFWIALLLFSAQPQAAPVSGPPKPALSAPQVAPATRPDASGNGVLNVNQATAEALAAGLRGVGLEKARAIVAFRERHGAFSHPDQLLQVKGIGAALLERNRAHLTF